MAAVAADATPLRSHARFMAVAHLGPSAFPDAQVEELPDGQVQVVFADGARYRLGLDGGRVVSVVGPLDLPPYASGDVTARLSDFRPVDGRLLAHAVHYELGGTRLADETLTSACVDDPRVTPTAFQRPDRIPDCMP